MGGGRVGWGESCLQGFPSNDVEVGLLTTGRLPPLLCQQVAIAPPFCRVSNNFIMPPHPPISPASLTPRLMHLHLVCYAVPAICTCLHSNYGVVKAPLPPSPTHPPPPRLWPANSY